MPNKKKPNFVQRYLYPSQYPVIENEDGTISTHRMADAEVDGKYIAYPTIVQTEEGELVQLEDEEALRYALEHGEYQEFPNQKAATEYAKKGYKQEWGTGDMTEYRNAHESGDIQRAFEIKQRAKERGTDTSSW